jgi:hypothetical protein
MIGVFGLIWWGFGAIAQSEKVSQNCTYLAPVFGDANEDLEINIADVVKIEREILGYDAYILGADANQNGEVDMGDVIYVERQILGLEPIYGDVDGNNEINQNDISKLEQILLGFEPSNVGADANHDGVVSMGDVVWINRMLTEAN